MPDANARDVGPRSFDQVRSARQSFRIERSHVADMLCEIVRLNLGERLIVSALDVGDRRARDGECCYQHCYGEHRTQQRGFGMELKGSHRARFFTAKRMPT